MEHQSRVICKKRRLVSTWDPSRLPTAAALFVLAGLVLPRTGTTHRAFVPRKVNRYMVLNVSNHEFRIEYFLYLGALPAMKVRNAWDTDGNGRLSAAEARRGSIILGRTVAASLAIDIDGKPASPSNLTPSWDLLGDPRVRPSALILRLEGNWHLSSMPFHRLSFEDKAGKIQELTPVGEIHGQIRSPPHVRILESHTGTWSSGINKNFRFEGPPSSVEDRRIFVKWANLGPADPRTNADKTKRPSNTMPKDLAALLATALLCLLGLVGTWYWLHRKNNRTIRKIEP